jgi:hypothetical protein
MQRTKIRFDLGLGAAYLTRRALRSDSRSHADFNWDLCDDLDVGLTTGYPRISLETRGRSSKSYFAADFWTGAFNGETEPATGFQYDGWSSLPLENLRTRFRFTAMCAWVGFAPSARLSGKVNIELGVKHVYMETNFHGALSGRHTDALHAPLLYPGLRVQHAVGRRVLLEGTLRAGGFLWSSEGFSVFILGFETDLEARFKMSDRLSLGGGFRFEHLSFREEKSGDRMKEAGIGFSGAFAEAVFSF